MYTVKENYLKSKNKNNSKIQINFLITCVKKFKNKNNSKTQIDFPKNSVKKFKIEKI